MVLVVWEVMVEVEVGSVLVVDVSTVLDVLLGSEEVATVEIVEEVFVRLVEDSEEEEMALLDSVDVEWEDDEVVMVLDEDKAVDQSTG